MSYIGDLMGAVVGDAGEACTLKRTGLADLPVAAKRLMKSRAGGGAEIANSLAAADLVFEISNAELAAVPTWGLPARTDMLVDSDGITYAVLHVDTRKHEGETVKHFLWVSG